PILAALSGLGALWRPLLLAVPLLVLTTVTPVAQGWLSASAGVFPDASAGLRSRLRRYGLRLLTALLHVIHPIARLCGRLSGRSGPPPGMRPRLPVSGAIAHWTERGAAPEARLRRVEERLQALGSRVRRGGDWDPWDLEVTCGAFGAARVIMAIEDHGAGNQLVRIRWWPNVSATALVLTATTGTLSVAAGFDGARSAAAILAT